MSLFRRTVDPSLLRIKLRLAKILAAAERERADEAEAELRQLSDLWYGDDEAEVPEESKTAVGAPKGPSVDIMGLSVPASYEQITPPAGMMDRINADIDRKDRRAELEAECNKLELQLQLQAVRASRTIEAENHRRAVEKLIEDNVKTLENAVAAAEKRGEARLGGQLAQRDIKARELRERNDELAAVIANLQQTVRNLLARPVAGSVIWNSGYPPNPNYSDATSIHRETADVAAKWIGPETDEAGVGPGRS